MPKITLDPRVDVAHAFDLLDDLQAVREEEAELNADHLALLNEICVDIDDAAMSFSVDSDFALLAAMTPVDFH